MHFTNFHFIETLFAHKGDHEQIEVRALAHASAPAVSFHSDISSAFQAGQEYAANGRDVYFGVCPRRQGARRGTAAAVVSVPALWLDIDVLKDGMDFAVVQAALESFSPRPTFIVHSGGGLHAYWVLNEPCGVSPQQDGDVVELDAVRRGVQVKRMLQKLAEVFCGDPSVCDLARIMRLPGTMNMKPRWRELMGHTPECRVIGGTGVPVDLSDLSDALSDQRALLNRPKRASLIVEGDAIDSSEGKSLRNTPVDVAGRLERMRYRGDGNNGIHITQLEVTASLVARGASDEIILDRVLAATRHAAGAIGNTWDWERERVGLLEMIHSARAKGFGPPSRNEPNAIDSKSAVDLQVLAAFPHSDAGNADRLVHRYGHKIMFVESSGWFVWSGTVWVPDRQQLHLEAFARATASAIRDEAVHLPEASKWARQSESASRISAMISLARHMKMRSVDDLDRHPHLLNVGNGIVNLETGALAPHDPSFLMTRKAKCEYDPAARAERFESFLNDICGGDAALASFLQAMCGYLLTADMREQVFFVLWGIGANGKTTLIETIASIMGDYAQAAPQSMLEDKPYSGIPNDIARLRGARLVVTPEFRRGRKIDEALVKALTGGDRIAARYLRFEYFDFVPTAKFVVTSNHRPVIVGNDEGIWRRVRLVPFSQQFVDPEKAGPGRKVKDPTLMKLLMEEAPGILAWAVKGAIQWYASGLPQSKAVEEVTNDYRSTMHPLVEFIKTRCTVDPALSTDSSKLREAFNAWASAHEYPEILAPQFKSEMELLGYRPIKSNNFVWRGIGLKVAEERPANSNHEHGAGIDTSADTATDDTGKGRRAKPLF